MSELFIYYGKSHTKYPAVEVNCPICGKNFLVAKRFLNRNKVHCCSQKCANKLRSQQKQQQQLDQWISEKHTCEHCGKLMTEKYGSGRFCCKACANTRKPSIEQRAKTSKSVQEYYYTHERTANQKAAIRKLGSRQRDHRHNIVQCCWCGKSIDITGKKKTKSGRYYCNGTCRNLHLNKLKEIGGINNGLNVSNWELIFRNLLNKYSIPFEANKRDLLPSGLEVDFWLPEQQVAVELNGIWHYSIKPYNGNEEKFKKRLEKDQQKIAEITQLGYKLYVFEDRNISDFKIFFTEFINNIILKL